MGTLIRHIAKWTVARLNIRSERGATAVEYGLMVALIAAVIIAGATLLGTSTNEKFNEVGEAIEGA